MENITVHFADTVVFFIFQQNTKKMKNDSFTAETWSEKVFYCKEISCENTLFFISPKSKIAQKSNFCGVSRLSKIRKFPFFPQQWHDKKSSILAKNR